MDRIERRGILQTRPSPDPRLDCVSTLEGQVTPTGGGRRATVNLRYVADRQVIDPLSFGDYLKALNGLEWESLEEVALCVLDDVNNEAVARWAQVTIIDPGDDSGDIGAHGVMVEDRQPKWDNPALLSRLRRN